MEQSTESTAGAVSVSFRVRSLVVNDLRSETKRSCFEFGHYLCVEVSFLPG